MLNLALDGADDLSARLDGLPNTVQAALAARIQDLTDKLQARVQAKLHGEVLNSRSGLLASSVQSEVEADGQSLVGRVFVSGDVKYAMIQEYGGVTSAHDIVPDKAKALAFLSGGAMVFAKLVHHPGSHIPERSYMRSSLAELAGDIAASLKGAAIDAISQGLGSGA
jgi:phage gpG-like protein